MLNYNAKTWWYVDAWRRIPSTWGATQSWSRVDAKTFYGDGSRADYEFSAELAEEFGALVRTFQWNGSTWEPDPGRSFGPYS